MGCYCGRITRKDDSRYDVYESIKSMKPDTLKKVLNENPDIDVNSLDPHNFTLLHYATMRGNYDIIDVLLERGADPNIISGYGISPISYAVNQGNVHIIQLLLRYGAEVNGMGNSNRGYDLVPLCEAIELSNLPVIKLLLDNGADVNASNNRLLAPLHLAAETGHARILELLLSRRDIELDIRDSYYRTPVHVAVLNTKLGTMKVLLSNEADPNVKDNTGTTPLIYATKRGYTSIVKELLLSGADVNAVDDRGYTAFTWFCSFHSNMSCRLAKLIASSVIMSEQGRTSLGITSNRMMLSFIDTFARHEIACLIEIEKMKAIRVGSDGTNLFTFCLGRRPNRIARYYPCAARALCSETGLHIYRDLIERNVLKGMTRRYLLKRALISIESDDDDNVQYLWDMLPYEIKVHILEGLSNRELSFISKKATRSYASPRPLVFRDQVRSTYSLQN